MSSQADRNELLPHNMIFCDDSENLARVDMKHYEIIHDWSYTKFGDGFHASCKDCDETKSRTNIEIMAIGEAILNGEEPPTFEQSEAN